MREYILTVTGAAVLSAFAGFMSPKNWVKYVRLITGLVVLCCICAPLASLMNTDFDFPNFDTETEYDKDLSTELVIEEFEKQIGEDISARMKTEYGLNVYAEVTIKLNSENEIEGVKEITVSGDRLSAGAHDRLCEIYGVDDIYEK